MLQNGQALFVTASTWSAETIVSLPMGGLPAGFALARVFADGIPSAGQILNIPALASRESIK